MYVGRFPRHASTSGLLAAALVAVATVTGCTGRISGSGSGAPPGGAATGAAGATAAAGATGSSTGGSSMAGATGAAGTGTASVGMTAAALCASRATPGALPAARIRRLTRLEVQNTITDLFGATAGALANGLEPDSQALGYSTGDQRGVSPAYVTALKTMAEGVAAQVRKTLAAPTTDAACLATDAGGRTCADKLVRELGRRAFRRPLEEREVTALLALYDAGRETGVDGDAGDRYKSGVDYALRGLLQSPHFIFRTELGGAGAAAASATALTPYELASALSYGAIASPPDDALMAAAAANQLTTPTQLAAQVRRLIASRPDRFKALVQRFAVEWLSIDYDKPAWMKDAVTYPRFTNAVRDAFAAETRAYLDDWVDGGSAFPALMTSTSSFVNKDNAAVYGLTSASATFVKTPLPAGQRAGLLTQPSFLGSAAHVDGSSPVARGLAVRTRFFCKAPPPVPAMVPPLPAVDKAVIKTTRQRFSQHTSVAFCAACHKQFDPMGMAFEGYDGIGQWRTQENGVAVDSSGAIVGTATSDGPVANAVELAKALAASPEVHECFTRQVFRFDAGRVETDDDVCAIAAAAKAFGDENLDLRALFVAIATSPSFASRLAAAPGGN